MNTVYFQKVDERRHRWNKVKSSTYNTVGKRKIKLFQK